MYKFCLLVCKFTNQTHIHLHCPFCSKISTQRLHSEEAYRLLQSGLMLMLVTEISYVCTPAPE